MVETPSKRARVYTLPEAVADWTIARHVLSIERTAKGKAPNWDTPLPFEWFFILVAWQIRAWRGYLAK